MPAFKKDQLIFYASTNFAVVGLGDRARGDVRLGVVIERQVDACGAKQITFYNRGNNDHIFGKKDYFIHKPALFNTAAEAFAYLSSTAARCDVICPDVYSDADKRVFDDFKSGAMRIAAKQSSEE